MTFNQKIDHFKGHEKYGWLRKYADDALRWESCCGFYQIKAEDFIKRIEAAPLDLIAAWLNGENKLEWKLIKAQ